MLEYLEIVENIDRINLFTQLAWHGMGIALLMQYDSLLFAACCVKGAMCRSGTAKRSFPIEITWGNFFN